MFKQSKCVKKKKEQFNTNTFFKCNSVHQSIRCMCISSNTYYYSCVWL